MVKRSTAKTTKRTTKKTGAAKKPAALLDRVGCLAHNLWWSWNPDAHRLLRSLDPALWESTGHNPVKTIHHLNDTRRDVLENDPAFRERFEHAQQQLDTYLEEPKWFQKSQKATADMHVAYFCMEYGIHECLPLYSGGLGILAGDHLKSASDLGIPLTAVGILWKRGYYRQEVPNTDEVRVLYPEYDFSELPISDTGHTVKVPIGRAKITAKIWVCTVGRVNLYLLDTDTSENKAKDRLLTQNLYYGDDDNRIRQEILLGVGGLMALDELKIKPTVFHLNEGHAAFCSLERIARLVEAGHDFEQARATVAKNTVFTTHTPVPAGNTRYPTDLFNRYMRSYGTRLGLNNNELLALGREDQNDRYEPFCMTILPLRSANYANGVAELHGATAREMWQKTFDAATPDNVPIGHVTNGIHPQSWIADEAVPFYEKHLKPKWNAITPTTDPWKNVDKVDDAELWQLRHRLRQAFITRLREHLAKQLTYHGSSQEHINDLYETLSDDVLTVGFARRFATYKRAPLVFKDARRLAKIMGDADRPVQLIFAGKAHPRDEEGNAFVKKIFEMTEKPPFRGRVWFVEDYNQAIGRMLTAGVDLWLNNPIRPMEASGTSGMKPCLNAGVNCSILDGWWPEGYSTERPNGWAIGDPEPQPTRAKQDKHDAEAIYELFENEIVPMFYERGADGVPTRWVEYMRNSMATNGQKFSAHRMLGDYVKHYYAKAHKAG